MIGYKISCHDTASYVALKCFLISYARKETMVVTLWGDRAPEFLAEVRKTKDVPIFTVITGLLAKTYFGIAYTSLNPKLLIGRVIQLII